MPYSYKRFVAVVLLLCVFFAVGCTPFRDKERSMLIEIIDEDVRNKNASYSTVAETPTDCLYIDAILSVFASGDIEECLPLFADSAVDALGAEAITDELTRIKNGISGDILYYTVESSGGKSHRGGEGVRLYRYIGNIYTTEDVYSFGFKVCDGYTFDDTEDPESYYHLWGFHVYQDSRCFYEDIDYYTEYRHSGEDELTIFAFLGYEGVPDPHGVGSYGVNGAFSDITSRQRIIEGTGVSVYSYVQLISNGAVSRFTDVSFDESCACIMEGLSEHGFIGDIVEVTESFDVRPIYSVSDSEENTYQISLIYDDEDWKGHYNVMSESGDLLFSVPMSYGW